RGSCSAVRGACCVILEITCYASLLTHHASHLPLLENPRPTTDFVGRRRSGAHGVASAPAKFPAGRHLLVDRLGTARVARGRSGPHRPLSFRTTALVFTIPLG